MDFIMTLLGYTVIYAVYYISQFIAQIQLLNNIICFKTSSFQKIATFKLIGTTN